MADLRRRGEVVGLAWSGTTAAWRTTGGPRAVAWQLMATDDRFVLSTADGEESFIGADASRLSVSSWWLGWSLIVSGSPERRYPGVAMSDVADIRRAAARIVAWAERQRAIEAARAALLPAVAQARRFESDLGVLLAEHLVAQRWIPYDRATEIVATRPAQSSLVLPPGLTLEDVLSAEERSALDVLARDPRLAIAAANERIAAGQMVTHRDFFDQVETSPLTEEQAGAVITFDNRVRVIAAAGSGKTSVMVARAAFAVQQGLVPPDRILMLAFNKAAAEELQSRVTARMAALGLPTAGLRATTFHTFGLDLIGPATRSKPRIAPWVENGQDLRKIVEIVDGLRDSLPEFRLKWDLFRMLYGQLSSEAPDGGEPDHYDSRSKTAGFHTYRGETVRSEGERLIANWLFLNGVDYRYEQPYAVDLSDSEHGQYRPDFYYPSVDVWHEHWALDAHGEPPASFDGYQQSMVWKKQLHRRFGTKLIETTWNDIVTLQGFPKLEADLRRHGQTLDWNPDRPIPGARPLEHERLAQLIRTFLSHVKANSLARADLEARLNRRATARTRLFVDLYWQIHERWEAELQAQNLVDFDDMLLQAAAVLEHDRSLSRYSLILVDEFQDTSHSRARLVRALSTGADKYLLAVGDDWQAINRFAGADIAAMTHFEEFFGPARTLYLQTTFRNPQPLADVAARFVSRNPAQLAKAVRSARPSQVRAVTIVRVASKDQLPTAIRRHLADLAERDPGSSVDILGRYRNDEAQFVPRRPISNLKVRFRTVHASKGLEADYIVLPNLTTGSYGFPSQVRDDPVLNLVLAGDDGFPHSEERRLFYVGLTRAKRAVTIFTVAGLESPFIFELVDDPDVTVTNAAGQATAIQVCPGCHKGVLTVRRGRYGQFYGCSRYRLGCTHTQPLPRT